MPAAAPAPASSAAPTLGIDAGGTATRWALADADGRVVAEGEAAPVSGVQLLDPAGQAALQTVLGAIARDCGARPRAVWAGVTGLDAGSASAFAALLAGAVDIAPARVRATSDIELLCRAASAPGESIVLYAGTGAIAAALDAAGTLQRAGGRGVVIDDAGGGHWIAREALRAVWRREDEAPGAAMNSPLGQALAARIGGSDWAATRAFVYGPAAGRGDLGRLALAVSEAADRDVTAHAILEQAGRELARLVHALAGRVGARPLVLAGRVFDLHPAIEAALAEALPPGMPRRPLDTAPHHAAARLARSLP